MTRQCIQFITYNNYKNELDEYVVTSPTSNPKAFDEFEINVIDLNSQQIWTGGTESQYSLRSMKDLEHISQMIKNAKNTSIVLVYPQNCDYRFKPYKYQGKTGYYEKIELKHMLYEVSVILSDIFKIPKFKLCFENTQTHINGVSVNSNFYFSDVSESLTKSNKSNKTTTLEFADIILTTLPLKIDSTLMDYLLMIKLLQLKELVPEWVTSLDMFDDKHLKKKIEEEQEIIRLANIKISELQSAIERNNRYKSLLYTTGNELSEVVFEIIENLLDVDLKNFKDEYKEDFIAKTDNITFVGEIKGVSSNVKSEHISQLDVHLQNYKDAFKEKGEIENVKSVLLINHQRNVKLDERQPIHDTQIKLAKRNESLIIETITLLKLYEMFKNHEIDVESVKNMFIEKVGLLKLDTPGSNLSMLR